MNWTDERIDVLRRLWADGLSASQIASTLGGVSRNAVIGKIHRLGLSGRVKAPQPRPARPRTPPPPARPVAIPVLPAAAAAAAASAPAPARAMAAGALAVKVVEREAALPAPLPSRPAEIVPLHGGVSLFDLSASACRWPLGDPAADDLRFCGTRVAPGDVYCRCHAEIAFPSRRKRA